MKKGLDAQYEQNGDYWVVNVPFGLNKFQMENIRKAIVQQQESKLQFTSKALYPDKCEMLQKSLTAANLSRVRQHIIVSDKKEGLLFRSTEKEHSERSIYIGA